MVPKLSSKHLDLNLGAKSWRPLQRGERSETGGIHAHRGRFLASSTGSLPSSPSASLLGDPRVHFASPGSSDKAPSSAGRLTPSSASAGLGPGMTDEEFERHAKELSDAQAAQFAAAEAQRLAQAAADAEAAEELQRKKMEELLNAQAELAAREREVKDKEDRIAALMRQEEERHAADVRKMEELARKEEEERRARLEKLDREEAERKANLEKLEAQRREERAVEEEQEVIRRLEEERQRLANEERLAIENKIKEEEEAEKAAKAAMRSKLLARENAIRERLQKLQDLRAAAAIHPPAPRQLPVIQPVSYAGAYRSPSMMSFRVPSPAMSTLDGPVFVPDDVRRAGEARKREEEEDYRALVEAAEAKVRAEQEHDLAEQRMRDEEYRDRLAAMELRDAERMSQAYATDERSELTTSVSSLPSRVSGSSRRHSEQSRRRHRSAESERRKSAEAADKRRQLVEGELAKRKATEEEAARKAEEAARIRGAEAAAYYMAKQDLMRPRRGSNSSHRVGGSYDVPGVEGRAGTLSPRADIKARALPASRSLRRKQTEPAPASVPTVPIQSPPMLPRDHREAGRPEPMMMPPRFFPSAATTTSPAQDERPDTPAMFIVVSGDRVPGYSHDVLQHVSSSAVHDVGRTPAEAYISGTEAGKTADREGKRAAVEKLVDEAEKLGADAVIWLRLQSPKPVDDTKVEFVASGIAVTLKFPTPDRPVFRHASPVTATLPNGKRLFDDVSRRPGFFQVASAPIVGLKTPSIVGVSQAASPATVRAPSPHEEGTATPKASAVGLPTPPKVFASPAAEPPLSPQAHTLPLPSPRSFPLHVGSPGELDLTPRGIPLPDSPAFSDFGSPRSYTSRQGRSKHRGMGSRGVSRTPRMMEELWIGDEWEESSPAMEGLKTPMAPALVYKASTPKVDKNSLIDFGEDKDLVAAREKAQNTLPCWEGLAAFG